MIAHFQAPDGSLYDTSNDHEALIMRPCDLHGNTMPSGNAMATTTLLKLGGLTCDLRYVNIAYSALVQIEPKMAQYPLGFGQWLQAASYVLSQPKEIAIVGKPQAQDTQALLAVAQSDYHPFQVMALAAPDPVCVRVPLLQNRSLIDGHAAAYVCMNSTCHPPVASPEMLRALLEKPKTISDGGVARR